MRSILIEFWVVFCRSPFSIAHSLQFYLRGGFSESQGFWFFAHILGREVSATVCKTHPAGKDMDHEAFPHEGQSYGDLGR